MPDRTTAAAGLRGARRGLSVFIAAGLLALLAICLGTVVASRCIAEADALGDAQRSADRTAAVVVTPLLASALHGVPGARERLDEEVRTRLDEGSAVEVVVWAADGTIVYSGHGNDVGRRLPLPDAVAAALGQGRRTAEFDDSPEVGQVPGVSRVVEVTVPLQLQDEPRLALEVYYDFARVDRQISALQARILPMAVLALLALQLVQAPIAVGLTRLVRRHVAERELLLERALSASDAERRAVAADLHDGAVQDITGAVFALTALRPSIDPEKRPVVQRTIESLTNAATSLRRLIIDIYPPDLTAAGLPGALDELADPLRRTGVAVAVDVRVVPPMTPEVAAAVYRVGREALANVATHACAENVLVQFGADPQTREVRLRVVDDGVGMAPGALDRVPQGHVGLRLLRDRVADLGGTLTVAPSDDGRGIAVVALLPTAGRSVATGAR